MRHLFLAAALLAAPAAAEAQRFDFIAFGDMPYSVPADYARVDRLIDRINAASPAFTIFVGDTKAGSTPCSDEMILRTREQFQRIAGALVYSVGDNEWTDCHRQAAGRFDPLERLEFVRRSHFATAQSLGQRPIAVERQADAMPAHARYVENSRWMHNGVLFVSLHIVGSNNNFEIRPGAPEEFMARDAANQAWIVDSFEKATREGALGIVIAYQADMWAEDVPNDPNQSGFARTIATLTAQGAAFGRPVLLINGDTHLLRIDQPLRDRQRRTLENVTRLMVMGAAEVHAVRVTVDPAEPGLFSFTPLRVPENAAAPRM